MREALNAVEAGEMVVVSRHGISFVLTSASHWNDKQVQAQRGFTTLVTDEESSDIRPTAPPLAHVYDEVGFVDPKDLEKINVPGAAVEISSTPKGKKNKSVGFANTPKEVESKVQEFAKDKGMKFCPNGHAIPAGRSKCMGKGCKYAK